jgi:hypothetical protein
MTPEFIKRHKAYNKHDTGWAKGAPSEDHTTYVWPGPLAAAGLLGGALRGELANPPVSYSGLVP